MSKQILGRGKVKVLVKAHFVEVLYNEGIIWQCDTHTSFAHSLLTDLCRWYFKSISDLLAMLIGMLLN